MRYVGGQACQTLSFRRLVAMQHHRQACAVCCWPFLEEKRASTSPSANSAILVLIVSCGGEGVSVSVSVSMH